MASAWLARGNESEAFEAFQRVVEAATDFRWLSRGDRVLLKLAMNSANPYPATTDPMSVWYMTEILKRKGAGEVLVGDQSGVQAVHWTRDRQRGSSRKTCASAGLLRVIEQAGARPVFFEEKGYDAYVPTTPRGPHHWPEPIWVTSTVNQVDHIVYLTRASSHVMGDITAGMKLGVGFLREDSRRLFHRGGEDFYAMYEEIAHVPEIDDRLRLSVCSGRAVLSLLGPDDGHVSVPDHGLLLASEDLLAHEILTYAWLQWNRENETSALSRATMGRVTRSRSTINRTFVWMVWRSRGDGGTPAIPLWQPGDLRLHPSMVNHMKRMGGRPEQIAWEQVGSAPAAGTEEAARQLARWLSL